MQSFVLFFLKHMAGNHCVKFVHNNFEWTIPFESSNFLWSRDVSSSLSTHRLSFLWTFFFLFLVRAGFSVLFGTSTDFVWDLAAIWKNNQRFFFKPPPLQKTWSNGKQHEWNSNLRRAVIFKSVRKRDAEEEIANKLNHREKAYTWAHHRLYNILNFNTFWIFSRFLTSGGFIFVI